jgi:hypothetical protein
MSLMIIYSDWRLAKEEVSKGNEVVYSEGGNSMLPIIKSRQPVTLSPVNPELLEKGDIVLAKVGRYVYTHLVKGIKPGQVPVNSSKKKIKECHTMS